MNNADIVARATILVGKPYSEVPCWRLAGEIHGRFPLPLSDPLPPERLNVGDLVSFGNSHRFGAAVGVYLGNGQVIVSSHERGVHIVPWRAVRMKYLWGARVA